jgi:hypothetical protein
VLLGLTVDSAHPEHDETPIAKRLLSTCHDDPRSLARACDSLAGRYRVLFETTANRWGLRDALGLRGVV